jgi:hypothetical protein
VEPDLSEFSYGFALTSEIVARHGLKRAGAPIFPTQLDEAKPGGGWDMKLPGLPIYLQFKRSDRMVRNTAKHAGKFGALPFYRMHLRRRGHSQQHQLLLDLESRGNHVFYAAPAFSTSEELNSAYVTDAVTAQSIFVKPSAIGPLKDDEAHHVAFQLPAPAYFCSEPTPVKATDLDVYIEQTLRAKAAQAPVVDARDFFERISEQLLDVYESREPVPTQRRGDLRQLRQRREPAEFAELIARTLFDVELLVVPRDDA